jgi:tRNA(adenine34) deaminase
MPERPIPVSDEAAMAVAMEHARSAAANGDVPVGAVVVKDGVIIAGAGNAREQDSDPTAHAEILALRAAAEAVGTWRLDGSVMVVTLEPCVMCAGALVNARIDRVVIGAMDEKAGALGSRYNVASDPRLNHEFAVEVGVRAQESEELLKSFFEARRERPMP